MYYNSYATQVIKKSKKHEKILGDVKVPKTWYVASDELAQVFTDWGKYIQSETLTTELVHGEPPAEAFVEKHKVEGGELTLGVKKN